MYQVNARGNLHQYPTDSGAGPGNGPNGDRNPAFFGLAAKWSTSTYGRLDPKFVGGWTKATRFDGTTAIAGTGGVPSDYALASDSPAKGIIADPVLPFDLAGTARPSTGEAAGAYA